MPTHICITFGTQYPPAERPPQNCLICEDEHQYIGLHGQRALLIQTPTSNLLWDCVSLIDPDTIALVQARADF